MMAWDALHREKTVITPCSAIDIIELNQQKEYTANATILLEHILGNKDLGPAAKLWQFLFSKARFDQELGIQISNAYLEAALQKSVRQIQRYIDRLVAQGYLLVALNFKKTGGQTTNTYYVRFPTHILEEAKKIKNRKREGHCIEETVSIEALNNWDLMAVEDLPIPGQKHPNDAKCSPPDINVAHNNKSSSVIIKKDNNKEIHFYVEPKIKKDVVFSGSMKNKQTDPMSNFKTETFHESGNDNKEISKIQEEITKVEQDIHDTQLKLTEVKRIANEIAPQEATPLTIRQNLKLAVNGNLEIAKFKERLDFEQKIVWPLDSKLILLNNRFAILNKKISTLQKEKCVQGILDDNQLLMAFLPGERPISTMEYAYLQHQLAKNMVGKISSRLINEICFAIRFGSLQKSPFNKPLKIKHAIHIAIKLIREKRWETPSGIEDFMKKKIH